MYNVIKGAIAAGGYKLADIQQKIKKFYVRGDLTEAQMDELLRMASGGVSTDAERPEYICLIQTMADKIEELEKRVTALEGGADEPEATYPEWKAWDGISKDYQMGAIVSHNGVLWESVFAGQNVWEPDVVNETFWKRFSN